MDPISGNTTGGPYQGIGSTVGDSGQVTGTLPSGAEASVGIETTSNLGNTLVGTIGVSTPGVSIEIGDVDVDVGVSGDVSVSFDQHGNAFDADISGTGSVTIGFGEVQIGASITIDGDSITIEIGNNEISTSIDDVGDSLQQELERLGVDPDVAKAVSENLTNEIGQAIEQAESGIRNIISNAISNDMIQVNDRGRLEELFQKPPVSPLVLDLDGDGIELTSLAGSTTFFDVDINGFAEATGWAAPDDGLLALDIDGDGYIDDGSELFGDQTGYDHGFLALAQHDSNSDGVIDENDPIYSDLVVWQDSNSDGISQAQEMRGLADVGVASISVSATVTNYEVAGNSVLWESTFEWSDGSQGVVADAYFETDTLNTVALVPDDFTYHPDVFKLPVLLGSGTLASTWVALSLDDDLRDQAHALLEQLESGNIESFLISFEAFILDWAGVSDVDPGSRGEYVDARHLEFLEAVYGTGYIGVPASTDPGIFAGPAFEELYEEFLEQLAARFLAQAAISTALLNGTSAEAAASAAASHPLASFSTFLNGFTPESPSLYGDVSQVIAGMQQEIDKGSISVGNAATAILIFKSDLSSGDTDFEQLVQTAISDAGLDPSSDLARALTYAGDLQIVEGTTGNDTITVTEASYVIGGTGEDVITSTADGVIFVGGKGNDTLNGGDGAATYIYSLGDGSDVILDTSGYATVNDKLLFTDVNADDVVFSHNADGDLVITLSDGGTVTIKNHFDSDSYDMELIEFADGTVLDLQDIRDKTVADQKATGSVKGSYNTENYFHALGDGSYTITDVSSAGWINDRLVFTDVNAEDVTFSQNAGGDLVITLSNGETVTISNHFDSDYYDTELIEFSDGTVLNAQEIRDKSVADQKFSGTVKGSYYVENYYHSLGDGSYTITDVSSAGDYLKDRLVLTDVNADDVTFSHNGNGDLVITLSNGEAITITDHFASSYYDMELIEFADGTVLGLQEIKDKAVIGGSGDDVLIGFSGNDHITGGYGNDYIDGGRGDDAHNGGDGDDILIANSGLDSFDGGAGNDTIDFSYTSNGVTLDLTAGIATFTSGAQEIMTNIENVIGSSGSNLINGSDVANVIDGGAGNDRIIGLEGDDKLSGGSGADVFVFNTLVSEGADTITDFELGTDTLELAGSTYTDLTFVDTGSGTRVEWDNGSVELEGVAVAALIEDQFLFV